MRILLCHSYYRQRGGEDQCFEEEAQLLRDHGHEVFEFTRSNEELIGRSGLELATKTVWNSTAARELKALLRSLSPEVVHFTNTFPLLSPAVVHAAHGGGAAVVQALHNYRLLCANGLLLREGRPCRDCLGKAIPWPAAIHRCYRTSVLATLVHSSMLVAHRSLGTWTNQVDAFFTPSLFARTLFADAGFPKERLHLKYNSVSAPDQYPEKKSDYFVFVGRLSDEKGLLTLLGAWEKDARLPRLRLIGDGPLAHRAKLAQENDRRIRWLGQLDSIQTLNSIAKAQCLIMPSICYETFGRTIAEAYAAQTPVIASRLGAMSELIHDGRTGLLFEAGNEADLSRKVHQFLALSVGEKRSFSDEAHLDYKTKFSPERAYQELIKIYQFASERARTRQGS